MKYILMMSGKKSDFEGYATWSKEDLRANVAFMRAFSKELKDSGVFVSTEGLGWPSEAHSFVPGRTENPSPMESFRNPRNFWPATGSSMWTVRSRRIRSLPGRHRHQAPEENLQTCPSKCDPY